MTLTFEPEDLSPPIFDDSFIKANKIDRIDQVDCYIEIFRKSIFISRMLNSLPLMLMMEIASTITFCSLLRQIMIVRIIL